jgi:protein involved in polysaccharide export with SLBB domain
MSRMSRRAFLSTLGVLIAACSPRPDNATALLPPPEESTTVGPGDVFVLEIVGEKELPKDFQVASDGTVDVPYVGRLAVSGLEPQEIAALVRERLESGKFLTSPSVMVRVAEYQSKRVTVLGQVQRPGSFPLTPGLTLVQVISLAGGFNSIANRNRLNLTRRRPKGSMTVTLSMDTITEGKSPDVPLQAGDQIYVHERVF